MNTKKIFICCVIIIFVELIVFEILNINHDKEALILQKIELDSLYENQKEFAGEITNFLMFYIVEGLAVNSSQYEEFVNKKEMELKKMTDSMLVKDQNFHKKLSSYSENFEFFEERYFDFEKHYFTFRKDSLSSFFNDGKSIKDDFSRFEIEISVSF